MHRFCRQILTIVLLLGGCFLPLFNTEGVQAQQPASGITAPESGAMVSGLVEVRGTAVHPDYLRYELAFWYDDNPAADWVVFAEGDQQIVDDLLALWDTTVGRSVGAPVFPDGRYRLRLRVVKTDYNYDEYYVTDLVVQNEGPTPTPTPDETAVFATSAAVSVTAAGDENQSFVERTPIPSLTPFPTLTPQATAVRSSVVDVGTSEPSGGILQQVSSVETERFGNAFLIGVQLVVVIFAALAIYLFVRGIARKMWRWLWQQKRHNL